MLTGRTRLVGVIGDPVAHSLSPRMQNAAFAARGLDWAYVPLPVPAAELEHALPGLVALGFAGANVTVPHKAAAAQLCNEVDEFAARAGSVNTIVVRDGRLVGSSTDGLAVVEAVATPGARVLLLGAGGSAQAVATALLDAGAESLHVEARRADAAEALLDRLRELFPGRELGSGRDDAWNVLVNATPVRDHVLVEPRPGATVVDLTYNGDGCPTALAAAAHALGCRVVDGLEVLLRQGAASFERWTGVPAPVEVMRASLRDL
jgi:shikimate dehydrogenase